MKIPNKREFQYITNHHLSDIDVKGVMICNVLQSQITF